MARPLSATHAWLTLALVCCSTAAQAVDLVGYLPNYRMSSGYVSNVLPGQLALLDEVRYFGLSVDSNGNIVPMQNSLQSHLNNLATIQGVIDSLPVAQRPRLGITLGGAGQDFTFTNVAVDANRRAALAQNIDALLTSTGATGIDINWEHPDRGVQRTTQYPAMLKRIKQEIGADRRVYATVAPSVVISNSVFSGPDAIDGASLMTYDMGWWSNDPSNPNNGEHSLNSDTDEAIEAWTEPPGSGNDRPWVFSTWGNGTPADRLGVGLPFYGKSLPAQNAYTYGQLVGGGSTTDGEYYQYFGQQVWSPSPELAAERIELAHNEGVQHVIIWEIAQDLPATDEASLLRSAFLAREALVGLPGDYNDDGTVDAADYTVWRDNRNAPSGTLPNDTAGGMIGSPQYDAWVANFGATLPSQAAAVPEPTAVGLLASLIGLGLSGRPDRTC